MSSSNDESRCSTGNFPAGPSWPRTTSPRNSRRSEADEVLELRGGDARDAVGVEQRRDAPPEAEREPAAGEPVHRRGVRRRDHRVAGVVVRRRRGDAERRATTPPTAPDSVTASLMLNRSEMNALPSPSASPAGTSSSSSAGDFGAPASA